MENLSDIERVVALINQGGWGVTGGSVAHADARDLEEAEVKNGRLMLWPKGNRHGFYTFAVDGLEICLSGPEDRPHTIRIFVMGTVREQMKKIDGGGWRDVPCLRKALEITNAEAFRAHEATVLLQKEEERLAQEAEVRAQAERAETERRASLRTFATLVEGVINGAGLKKFCIDENGTISITFDNEAVILIERTPGEHVFQTEVIVSCGGKTINVDTGRSPPRY